MGKIAEYWKKVTGEHDSVAPEVRPPGDHDDVSIRGSANDVPITRPTGSRGDPTNVHANDDPRRRLESFGLSHVGMVRKGNEDHFVIASIQRSVQIRQTNLDDREILDPLCGPKAYLFAVADGVGGQDGGRLASGITVRSIVEYLSETVGSYHAVPAGREHAFLDPLGTAVQRAHANLLETFGLPQGGPATTLTIALLVWPQAYVVHVGDSRAYHLRGGRLQRLTRDQTMGAYLVAERAMSEQEVEKQGYNNVLSSAVGSRDMTPAVSRVDLEQGDILLLCTDGLTKHVSEQQIAEVLGRATDAESGCRELVDLALADGGRDNVTVVVASALTT